MSEQKRSNEHLAAVYLASWKSELTGLIRRAENRERRGLPVLGPLLTQIGELRRRIAAVDRGDEWENPNTSRSPLRQPHDKDESGFS